MNVKELKELISNLPDDMIVILQKDSEGNGYSPLSSCYINYVYLPENTWSGEVYPTDQLDEDDCDESMRNYIKSLPKVLLLSPAN